MSIYSENIVTLLLIIAIFYFSLYLMKKFWEEKLKKKGIFIEDFVIMFKTEKINRLINYIALRGLFFWKIFSTIGIFTGIYLTFLGIYFLHNNLLKFLYIREEAAPIVPVIPFITLGIEDLPFLIISFIITLIFHEFAHGIVAVSENIPVKSSGIFFFILFLGGFIEPDEDILIKRKLLSKLRVFSAGSFSNYLIGLVFSLLLTTFFLQSNGVMIVNVMENYPASHYLKPFDIIAKINGTEIKNVEDLSRFMNNTIPGQVVNIEIIRDSRRLNYTFRLGEKEGRGLIGVTVINNLDMIIPAARPTIYYTYKIFLWIIITNTSVAVINMLPIFILDGGQVFSSIINKYVKKEGFKKMINIMVSAYFTIILISNIVFTFLFKKYGWILP